VPAGPVLWRQVVVRVGCRANELRFIACAENYQQHIGLPRGCLEDVQKLLSGLKIKTVIRDERCEGSALARHLRIPRDTVERWIHNGNLRAVNVGTRSTLVARPRAKLRETLRDCAAVLKPVESFLA
jgi:excisionase family DNA binding protein